MKSQIYRNLDEPFKIFSFKPFEIIILCLLFILCIELSKFFEINRIWVFVFNIILIFSLVWIRKSLGDLFFNTTI